SKTSCPDLFAPSPRQNRGYRRHETGGSASVKKGRRNKALAPYGTALSPDRQTRYELESIFRWCRFLSVGGSPWQPRQSSGDRSPPWLRHSRTAPPTRGASPGAWSAQTEQGRTH